MLLACIVSYPSSQAVVPSFVPAWSLVSLSLDEFVLLREREEGRLEEEGGGVGSKLCCSEERKEEDFRELAEDERIEAIWVSTSDSWLLLRDAICFADLLLRLFFFCCFVCLEGGWKDWCAVPHAMTWLVEDDFPCPAFLVCCCQAFWHASFVVQL
jgi:hypothetical protein